MRSSCALISATRRNASVAVMSTPTFLLRSASSCPRISRIAMSARDESASISTSGRSAKASSRRAFSDAPNLPPYSAPAPGADRGISLDPSAAPLAIPSLIDSARDRLVISPRVLISARAFAVSASTLTLTSRIAVLISVFADRAKARPNCVPAAVPAVPVFRPVRPLRMPSAIRRAMTSPMRCPIRSAARVAAGIAPVSRRLRKSEVSGVTVTSTSPAKVGTPDHPLSVQKLRYWHPVAFRFGDCQGPRIGALL